MKKIILLCVSMLLVLSFCLGLSGCKEEKKEEEINLTTNYEAGIYFGLPTDFVAKNLSYGDYVYTDGENAYFILNVRDDVEIEEDMHLRKDITVREYAQIWVTKLQCDGYKYDEKTDSATFSYVHEYNDGSDMPSEYYVHKILRNESAIYDVVLTCDNDDFSKYQKTFNAILKSIALAEEE